MNTTERIESTGEPDKIHVSEEYASLLIAANRGSWLTKRDNMVTAKGKGDLTVSGSEMCTIQPNALTNKNRLIGYQGNAEQPFRSVVAVEMTRKARLTSMRLQARTD